jgi:hypothetical protein
MAVVIGGGTGNAISINGSVGSASSIIASNGTDAFWTSNSAEFETGTLMLFQQTAAPRGWTKQTTHNNKALRVVSGTASSGGTTAFTTVFASKTPAGTIGNTTLTTTQIPSHSHSTDLTLQGNNGNNLYWGSGYNSPPGGSPTSGTGSAGSNGAHNHSFTGTALDFAVQYVDLIIASKN